MKGKEVRASKEETSIQAIPLNANAAGNVHGGDILKWIDSTAGVVAQRHCGEYAAQVATAVIDSVQFLSPAHIGDLIIFKASLNYTGRTSMEIGVRVEIENLRTGKKVHTSSAYLTFVAMDKNGRPIPIPSVIPVTKTEKRRFKEGKERSETRKANRKAKQKK